MIGVLGATIATSSEPESEEMNDIIGNACSIIININYIS